MFSIKIGDIHIPRDYKYTKNLPFFSFFKNKITMRLGTPKGFAFVRFYEEEDAVDACDMNEKDINGSEVGVQVAKFGIVSFSKRRICCNAFEGNDTENRNFSNRFSPFFFPFENSVRRIFPQCGIM